MAKISALPDDERSTASSYKSMFWIVTGLACVAAVASGLSRFAYGLVLPAMQSALNWSYTTGGAINTASAFGYLFGAMAAAPLAARFGERKVVIIGTLVTVITVLTVALSGNIVSIGVSRAVAGASAAAAFIAGAAIIARLVDGTSSRWKALMFGVYFGLGGGVGIVIPGLVIPVILDHSTWQLAWISLGLLSLVALGVSILAVRAAPAPAAAVRKHASTVAKWPVRLLGPLLAAYGVFGAGYLVYMTFIVSLLEQRGVGKVGISAFWVVLGLGAIAGAFVWSPLLGRLSGGRGPAVTLLVTTIGSVLPLFANSEALSYLSAGLFGVSFLAAVAAVISCAHQVLEPRYWTSAIAGLTVLFSIGQCIGPVLSGAVSDGAQGVRTGLIVGAALLMASTLIAVFQPGPKRHTNA